MSASFSRTNRITVAVVVLAILIAITVSVVAVQAGEYSPQQTVDLEVTQIQIPPTPICAGSSVYLYAYFQNNGDMASGGFWINWDIDGQFYDEYHYGLAAGAIDIRSYYWQNIPLGVHTVSFTVDAYDDVPETDEGNNLMNIGFEAVDCTPPNPRASAFSPKP